MTVDVLVVGGGPVGFVTALGLAQAGVSVELIEAAAGIGTSPRAAVYHWSVLDGLDRLGMLEEACAAGLTKQDYSYLIRATGEWIHYDLTVLGAVTRHPYNVHLGQHRLAEIAHRKLSAHANARVRFGTRLDRIEQDGEGVTAHLQGRDAPIRARWLVGADGAGSSVRKAIGLPFEGSTWPERFVATNVHYDFERDGYGLTTLVVDAAHGAVIVKLDNEGLWRCTYMEDAALPEHGYVDRIGDAYRALLPRGGPYRIERASPYQMHQRAAPRFRAGRVLLAGDAAHVTNPTGGLGLTSGLFDAFLLHPSLAAVIRDGADAALLDHYAEARRRMFVDRVSPQAVRNKQLVFHANGGGAALDQAVGALRRMARDPDFRLDQLMFVKSLETPFPAEEFVG